MDSTLDIHRLQFAFTITFHYIFPQLTMGLALLVFILKTLAIRTGNERYNEAATASDAHLRHQLRAGRGHGNPHGISVWH